MIVTILVIVMLFLLLAYIFTYNYDCIFCRFKNPPLFDYCKCNNIDKIHELHTSNKLNINITGRNGNNALMITKNIVILKILLKYGIDINHQNKTGDTVLHQTYNEKIIQFLLKNGCNPNIKNNEGNTPLMNLAKQNKLCKNIVDLYLKYDADITIKNKKSNKLTDILKNNLKISNDPNIYCLITSF